MLSKCAIANELPFDFSVRVICLCRGDQHSNWWHKCDPKATRSVIAPNRQSDMAQLSFRALAAGSIACFMTACVAGILI